KLDAAPATAETKTLAQRRESSIRKDAKQATPPLPVSEARAIPAQPVPPPAATPPPPPVVMQQPVSPPPVGASAGSANATGAAAANAAPVDALRMAPTFRAATADATAAIVAQFSSDDRPQAQGLGGNAGGGGGGGRGGGGGGRGGRGAGGGAGAAGTATSSTV